MKKPHVQQRTERRISAALRLVMVAVLLVAQIALVFLLSDVLKQRMALAYSALELLAAVVAVTIWSRPGATSYKIGWVMLVLFVPVVGVILYLLWNGARQSKRLDLKSCPGRKNHWLSRSRPSRSWSGCGRLCPVGIRPRQDWTVKAFRFTETPQ